MAVSGSQFTRIGQYLSGVGKKLVILAKSAGVLPAPIGAGIASLMDTSGAGVSSYANSAGGGTSSIMGLGNGIDSTMDLGSVGIS